MIEFLCKCGYKIRVEDKFAGKTGKCPKCKSPITVPQIKRNEEQVLSSLVSVFCGKCNYKQGIPKKLLHKAFVCENCGNSTFPYTEEKDISDSNSDEVNGDSHKASKSESFGNQSMSNNNGLPIKFGHISLASIPLRFSKYLSNNESIKFASNPSLSSLILGLVLPILGLFIMIIGIFISGDNSLEVIISIIIILVFISAKILSWRLTYYIVTDKKVFSHSGILNRRITIIPIANVNAVSVNTGIIDSLLGLNSIVFSSAGNGGAGYIFSWFPFMTPGTLAFKYVANAPEICKFISE